jgi:cyclic pyranopterin phosphate synthase
VIEVYVDGAHNPISDQGGWGIVILENGEKHAFSGLAKQTTNNRMEITAAIEGISRTPPKAEITVHTDSQYLLGTVTKNWQRKVNRDLWAKLDEVMSQHKVHWKWTDQTAKNPLHLEAHSMATALASQAEMPIPPPPAPAKELTHLDDAGRPKMVDIGEKADTERQAIAKGIVKMQAATFSLIKQGKVAKGDVLTTAQLAGIMAAKKAPYLIPLCHPILITNAKVEFKLDEANSAIEITATVDSTGKTGVEMEALTAVAVAALTIYDMCKAVDRGMRIENIRLVRKSGGKSGTIGLE